MDSKRPILTGLLAHRWEPIRIKSCQLAVSSVLLGLHFIVLLQKALQIPNILHSWQLWWEVCQVLASFLQVGHQKVVTDRKKPGRISVCEHYTGCCTDFHLNGIAAMFFFTVLFELTPSNSATNEKGLLCCYYSFRHVFVLHSSVLSSRQTLIIFLPHFLVSRDQIKWDTFLGRGDSEVCVGPFVHFLSVSWVCEHLSASVSVHARVQSDESVSLSTFPDRDAEWVPLRAACSVLTDLMFPEVLNGCEGGHLLVWKQHGRVWSSLSFCHQRLCCREMPYHNDSNLWCDACARLS